MTRHPVAALCALAALAGCGCARDVATVAKPREVCGRVLAVKDTIATTILDPSRYETKFFRVFIGDNTIPEEYVVFTTTAGVVMRPRVEFRVHISGYVPAVGDSVCWEAKP